ncbi:hypothetical protein NUM_23340 [Actinocatenispora comari]|uniref:Uncharacterized protein n=1 Tax=Actinocatenispora comari TaxID=2807577 RepID=A0A8J4ACB0_9ACTN|nr:hypothetical protein NUM_23340 [Actinocatenispora comari]
MIAPTTSTTTPSAMTAISPLRDFRSEGGASGKPATHSSSAALPLRAAPRSGGLVAGAAGGVAGDPPGGADPVGTVSSAEVMVLLRDARAPGMRKCPGTGAGRYA